MIFLSQSACRPGEAAGLRWKSIGADFSTAWIGESISRGHLNQINPKAPYLSKWQDNDCDREFIATELQSGNAVGIGLRLGEPSGYVVAIDFDGQSAIDFWCDRFGEVPHTVTWTSGKPGRYQALFQVPPEYQHRLTNKKVKAGGDYLAGGGT